MALAVEVYDRQDAFAEFYVAHAPRVAGLARRILLDPGLIDDVVQDALLRAYRSGLHLDDARDPWPWLATVTRNLCRDVRRRSGRAEVPVGAVTAVAAEGPDRVVEDGARSRFVDAALAALPPRQRNLLVAHHMEEVPCPAIAASEGTSVEAVKSALARARDSFRTHYQGWRGLVPELVGSVTSALRTVRQAIATPGAAGGAPMRPGLASLLAALLALGLAAPSSRAGEPAIPGAGDPVADSPTHASRSPRGERATAPRPVHPVNPELVGVAIPERPSPEPPSLETVAAPRRGPAPAAPPVPDDPPPPAGPTPPLAPGLGEVLPPVEAPPLPEATELVVATLTGLVDAGTALVTEAVATILSVP